MTARSKARKRALDVLFEADQRGSDPMSTARERSGQALSPFGEYAFELVDGVTRHRAEIDQILAEYAEGWTLDRMPAVDRAVLRLGTYELLFAPGRAGGRRDQRGGRARPRAVHGRVARLRERPARQGGVGRAGARSAGRSRPRGRGAGANDAADDERPKAATT